MVIYFSNFFNVFSPQGRSVASASRWVAPPAPVFTDAVEPDVVDPVYVPYSEESVKNCHGKK